MNEWLEVQPPGPETAIFSIKKLYLASMKATFDELNIFIKHLVILGIKFSAIYIQVQYLMVMIYHN